MRRTWGSVPNPTVTWVVSDGRAGNRRQALALADAMQCTSREFCVELPWPWRWWAPRGRWPYPMSLPRELRQELANPPGMVIGCGRAAAFIGALLRRQVEGCKAIQILDPRISMRHFDAVLAPRHDRLRGANVIETTGSLHAIDGPWLARAAAAHVWLRDFRSPRLAIMLGGPHSDWGFGRRALQRLLDQAAAWQAAHDGALWITTSRRTPPEFVPVLQRFADAPDRLLHAPDSASATARVSGPRMPSRRTPVDNPYPGFLALADAIVVTADSVNMASEACGTTCPVIVFEAERARGKLARFHRELGKAAPTLGVDALELPDFPSISASRTPLREAPLVAARLRTLLHLD